LENKVTKSKVQSKEVGKGDNSDIQTDDIKILNEKVKRLEGLLSRCKDTIKTNKEKYTQITTEKEQINKQLHEKNTELEKLKSSAAPDTMIKLQNQMKEARKVIEQLEVDREVAIAEVKKQVHEEMELKDQELREIRQQCALLQEENKTNTDKVDRLEKSSQETLEKSREIIKRLKDEKKQVVVESEERIKQAEKTIEEEKENLIQELSRAKAAAVTCLQEETHKKVEGEVQKTVEERDQFWEKQIHDMEKQHSSAIQTLIFVGVKIMSPTK
ncbi:golgin 4 subfamily a member, partial [Mytilus galloprovincialis]